MYSTYPFSASGWASEASFNPIFFQTKGNTKWTWRNFPNYCPCHVVMYTTSPGNLTWNLKKHLISKGKSSSIHQHFWELFPSKNVSPRSGSTDIRASNLCSWTRFQTGPDGKFRFAPYLNLWFLQPMCEEWYKYIDRNKVRYHNFNFFYLWFMMA